MKMYPLARRWGGFIFILFFVSGEVEEINGVLTVAVKSRGFVDWFLLYGCFGPVVKFKR